MYQQAAPAAPASQPMYVDADQAQPCATPMVVQPAPVTVVYVSPSQPCYLVPQTNPYPVYAALPSPSSPSVSTVRNDPQPSSAPAEKVREKSKPNQKQRETAETPEPPEPSFAEREAAFRARKEAQRKKDDNAEDCCLWACLAGVMGSSKK